MKQYLFILFASVFVSANLAAQSPANLPTFSLADTAHAHSLLQEGIQLHDKKQYEEANNKFDRAVTILKGIYGEESWQPASYLVEIGNVYLNSKTELNFAIHYHKQALDVWLKIPDPKGNAAWTSELLAIDCNTLGLYDESIKYSSQAIRLFKELNGDFREKTAFAYNGLGISYKYKGEYDLALKYFLIALNIRETLPSYSKSDLAFSYFNAGNTYWAKGDYKNGNFYRKCALDIRLQLKKQGVKDKGIIYSYNSMGEGCLELEDYDNALYYFFEALKTGQEMFSAGHPNFANSYNYIAVALIHKGELNKAHEYTQKAFDIRKKVFGENSIEASFCYDNFAKIHLKKKEIEQAASYFQQSLEIKKSKLGNQHMEVRKAYQALGNLYLTARDPQKSKYYYQLSLSPDTSGISRITAEHIIGKQELSNIAFLEGNPGEAIAILRRFMPSPQKIADLIAINPQLLPEFTTANQYLSKYYLHQFRLDHKRQALDSAIYYNGQALAAMTRQQKAVSSEQSKSRLLAKNFSVFESAIQIGVMAADLDQNDSLRRKTFDYAEQSKAALLRTRLKETEALHFAGIPDSLLELEYSLRIDITWFEKQRQEKLHSGLAETDTTTLHLSNKLFNLRQRYDSLQARFEREFKDYYELKYLDSTISLAILQTQRLAPDQTLLEYFAGDSVIYIFVVNTSDFHIATVKRDFPLDSLVHAMRMGLTRRFDPSVVLTDVQRQVLPATYAQSAYRLFEKLVVPVRRHLRKRLIVIPDGSLNYLPFEALLTEPANIPYRFSSHRYLINDHTISYCYSATLWEQMENKQHAFPPGSVILGMAPYFSGDTAFSPSLYAHAPQVRRDFKPLPYAGKEVSNIVAIMGGKGLYGRDANRVAFDKLAPQFQIIHLSTHGQANDLSGDYSFLAFGDQADSTHANLLYVRDLYNFKLNADLVTLSACETGLGELQRGEGIVSLARAFSYAGAKSIVTSLWSVEDKRTQELMTAFYKALHRGKLKDAALQEAKLALIRRYGDPYFWAGFIGIGDMHSLPADKSK